jgi:hypothetical protein
MGFLGLGFDDAATAKGEMRARSSKESDEMGSHYY